MNNREETDYQLILIFMYINLVVNVLLTSAIIFAILSNSGFSNGFKIIINLIIVLIGLINNILIREAIMKIRKRHKGDYLA